MRKRSRSPRNRRSRFTDINPEHNEQDIIRSLETVKNSQTTKVDRKLYVGNLPAGISQSQLVDLLNTALINQKKNAYAGDPVLSAWISQDGHYAFVEFRSIEEANQGFSLNNYPILGQNIKVGRPKTYIGPQPASATDRNTLMGGYTLPTMSAFANLTDMNKQGPLKPLKVKLSSSVLCLQNILANTEGFEEVKKFAESAGTLLEIYKPSDGEFKNNVYLEYSSIHEAKVVFKLLIRKKFNGKPLVMKFIPLERFKNRELEDTDDLEVILNA